MKTLKGSLMPAGNKKRQVFFTFCASMTVIVLLYFFVFGSVGTTTEKQFILDTKKERNPVAVRSLPDKPLQMAGKAFAREKIKNGHNPFIIPPEFVPGFSTQDEEKPLRIAEKITSKEAGTPAGTSADDLSGITVTGIAIGSNQIKLAVINNGTTVKSYRPGEYAGKYRIEEITPDAVIVDGPFGRKKLFVSSNLPGSGITNTEGTDKNNDPNSKTAD